MSSMGGDSNNYRWIPQEAFQLFWQNIFFNARVDPIDTCALNLIRSANWKITTYKSIFSWK